MEYAVRRFGIRTDAHPTANPVSAGYLAQSNEIVVDRVHESRRQPAAGTSLESDPLIRQVLAVRRWFNNLFTAADALAPWESQ